MIEVKDLFKAYATRSGKVTVLQDINFSIRAGEKIGILGGNGAGKSTLIRLISGAERPTSGSIKRDMSVSWPLAFGGAFQGTLTGLDNFRFICRIHGVEWRDKLPFIEDFSELGKYLKEPVKTYSSGMRARLAFAISMTVEFDCFLIDEIVAVGDSRFNAKCNHELFEKRRDRAMIIVSHQSQYILDHCTRAAVLHQGRLIEFEDVHEALDSYSKQMQ